MKKKIRIIIACILALMMTASCMISASADEEPIVYYFVDCGDYTVETVSEGDSFGQYNSVTDQFFGADPSTGKQWGVVDEGLDEAGKASYDDSRVLTTWTWAYEYNEVGVDVPKEQSNRYCRNMMESGKDRVITYKFEMPENGNYVVEVGFANPWNNSSPVDLYLNGEVSGDMVFIDQNSSAYTYATVSPVDGFITVEAKSTSPTINMAYIIISNVLTSEETTAFDEGTEYVPDLGDGTDPETTKAPDGTNAPTNSGDGNSTDNSGSDKTEGGCGSVVTSGAVIAAAVVCAAVFSKKKRS